MQAVILAAGMGKRFRGLTKDKTKCMLSVGGMTIIERSLRAIEALSFDRVILVTGYQREGLEKLVESLSLSIPVIFVRNEQYKETNNIFSLSLTSEYLAKDDTVVLESDIVFEEALLRKMLDDPEKNLCFVAKPEVWMDGSVVTLDEKQQIREFISTRTYDFKRREEYFKTVSIYKFSKEFLQEHYLPMLKAYVQVYGRRDVYESALKVIAMQEKTVIPARILTTERWYEINDIQDLDIAESLFATGTDKLSKYLKRFGGYWRYPYMLDYCYLVNPYFPNERFMNEMKSSFETLIREYPSGMAVNSLLAAEYFEIRPDQVLVGNGSAELIKSLMESLTGKIGVLSPSFEEYAHRVGPDRVYYLQEKDYDFSYTVEEVEAYFADKDISTLVIINPDNPSGFLFSREDLCRLAKDLEKRQVTLIVDESFVDFSEGNFRREKGDSLLIEELLDAHKNLVVMKSISKSFGVAGLRLGVLASGNTDLIAFMKKDVAIWNINSFAEYYMQIIKKYKDDYEDAMKRFLGVRERYLTKLKKVPHLVVYPTQANFVMCRLEKEGLTSLMLADVLLSKYNILIKDLSGKNGLKQENYVRLSVKTDEENDALIDALMEVLG